MVSTIGAIIALATSVEMYNRWRIYLCRDRYEPAILIVDEVKYWPVSEFPAYWGILGRINGTTEEFSLVDSVPEPLNVAALTAQFPPGSQVAVWYDPSASRIQSQGMYLRVLRRDLDLQSSASIVRGTLLFDGMLIVGGLIIVCSVVAKHFRHRAGGNWSMGA